MSSAPQVVISEEPSSSSSDDEWDIVAIKSQKKILSLTNRVHSGKLGSSHPTADDFKYLLVKVEKTVEMLRQVFERERLWERYAKYLGRFDCIRAYGIGSMESSILSSFQFAMLVLLKKQTDACECYFYDPAASVADIEVIKKFGITYFPTDTLRVPDSSSRGEFMFMPHCDRTLYEWALAHRIQHEDTIFLSNFFSFYSIKHAIWHDLLSFFLEEPLMIFATDYEREDRKPKIARKAIEIPFEAFNDLAFVTLAAGNIHEIADVIRCEPEWCRKLD